MQHFCHCWIQIRLPDDQVLIVATGDDEVAQRGESRGGRRSLMAVHSIQDVTLAQIPDLDSRIVRS